MYTHFYQLWKRVPRARRKELAKFIHRFKCLCGRKYHLHVTESLNKRSGDKLSINVSNITFQESDGLLKDVVTLMDEFNIPRKNFRHEFVPYFVGEESIMVYLYTDFK